MDFWLSGMHVKERHWMNNPLKSVHKFAWLHLVPGWRTNYAILGCQCVNGRLWAWFIRAWPCGADANSYQDNNTNKLSTFAPQMDLSLNVYCWYRQSSLPVNQASTSEEKYRNSILSIGYCLIKDISLSWLFPCKDHLYQQHYKCKNTCSHCSKDDGWEKMNHGKWA